MKKWTIGMVNYYSSVYIKWQLKILYEFNIASDFQLIIVDNSNDKNEFYKLKRICIKYNELYSNIELIQYKPRDKTASGQHGEGLDIIASKTNSKYLITQDPDFFWLKQNYLVWLESLMKYNDAVGIPYPNKVYEGHPNFPGSFGCAYNFQKIKNISFKPYINDDILLSQKKHKEFIENKVRNNENTCFAFSYDVGWKIRKKLSKIDDYNFISFNQVNIYNYLNTILKLDTNYSFETNSTLYTHNGQVVALHLFRGTFTGIVEDHKDKKSNISQKLLNVRSTISNFMYNEIKKPQNSQLIEIYKYIIRKRSKHLRNTANINFNRKIFLYLLELKKIPIIKILIPIKSRYIKQKLIKHDLL